MFVLWWCTRYVIHSCEYLRCWLSGMGGLQVSYDATLTLYKYTPNAFFDHSLPGATFIQNVGSWAGDPSANAASF